MTVASGYPLNPCLAFSRSGLNGGVFIALTMPRFDQGITPGRDSQLTLDERVG
jgi:hypothetical protein